MLFLLVLCIFIKVKRHQPQININAGKLSCLLLSLFLLLLNFKRRYHHLETPSEISVYLRNEDTLFVMKIVHVQFGTDFTDFPVVYGILPSISLSLIN